MRYPLKLRNIVGWQDWHHLVHDQTCLTTNSEHGKHCRAMKTKNGSHIVIYSPMDGRLEITDESVSGRNGIWFYPRTGNLSTAEYTLESGSATFQKPNGVGWILILRQ